MNQPTGKSVARELKRRAPLLILIFLTGLGVRACGAVTAPAEPSGDAVDYHQLAVRLAEGRGYVNSDGNPTAWRPPGQPAFLAVIYRIAGPRINVAAFVQVVFGALTVLALVVFGAIVIGWREGLIAGFVAAVYPGFVWLPRLLLSENLSLFLMLVTLSAAALFLKKGGVWWLAFVGFVGGLNTLVRGSNLMFLVVLCAGVLFVALRWEPRRRRQAVLGLVLAVAAFAIALTPWTIRNYRVFQSFVPVATQDGLTLYGSYWPPQRNGRFIWGTLPGPEDPEIVAARRQGDEVSASRYLNSVTRRRLLDNPGYFFRLIPSKMISLLAPLDWEIFPHAAGSTRSVNYGYLLLIVPAAIGFWLLLRQRIPHRWLLMVAPATVLVQAILFYGSPRFRLPAEPIAILLAAICLWRAGSVLIQRVAPASRP